MIRAFFKGTGFGLFVCFFLFFYDFPNKKSENIFFIDLNSTFFQIIFIYSKITAIYYLFFKTDINRLDLFLVKLLINKYDAF
jgi:hypothetical protein